MTPTILTRAGHYFDFTAPERSHIDIDTMTTPTTSPHIDQVHTALLATLADLRDRTNPMDLDRAKAVATVAAVLVDTARVENDYLKLTGQDHSKFLETEPDASEAQPGTTVSPGDLNGITSITQHRLRG